MYKGTEANKEHQEKRNFKRCGTIVIDGHSEVCVVYLRQNQKKYYNCMADKEANVIVLR